MEALLWHMINCLGFGGAGRGAYHHWVVKPFALATVMLPPHPSMYIYIFRPKWQAFKRARHKARDATTRAHTQ